MSFINEDINQGILKDVAEGARYSLYTIFVTKEQQKRMKAKLEEFKKKSDKLKFSIFGLFNIAVGKETHKDNEYFCSQFVVEILRAGEPDAFKKDSSLYTPYDLSKIHNVKFVTRGKLANYKHDQVDMILDEWYREGILTEK
jgi:hypothetical protein